MYMPGFLGLPELAIAATLVVVVGAAPRIVPLLRRDSPRSREEHIPSEDDEPTVGEINDRLAG